MNHLSRRGVLAAAAFSPIFAAWATDRLAPFRRGVSIHNAMNWGDAEADKTRYRWPPFGTAAHRLSSETLDNVKRAGFDFIRLTIDPGVFLSFTGAQRDELDVMLLAQTKALLARGFGVIADFHPNSQLAAYAPEKITQTSDSALFKAYGEMLVRTARLLAPYSGQRVAFELMNEPQWGWDGPSAQRWQDQQKTWHDAVRSVAPDLTLVLTGARGGSPEGLMLVDPTPFKSSKVLWSFHYYEPFLLTHQGVKADNGTARFWRYFSDLPYPATPDMFDTARSVLRANVMADASLSPRERDRTFGDAERALREYLNGSPGRARVAADFGKLEDWAKKHGVALDRLFMGEFGITRTYGGYKASPPGPLENWLSDVRSEAEKRNIGWAFWALSGYGGMSLIETDNSSRLDAPTLKGLGLTPP